MKRNAFTLREVVIALVIVVILAKVAIPVYQDIARQSRAAAVRATLDEVRAAIKVYRSNEKLEGRTESWPSISYVVDQDDAFGSCTPGPCPSVHIFTDCMVPDNPFSAAGTAACMRDEVNPQPGACTSATRAGPNFGWCYDGTSGLFWAPTNVMGEKFW